MLPQAKNTDRVSRVIDIQLFRALHEELDLKRNQEPLCRRRARVGCINRNMVQESNVPLYIRQDRGQWMLAYFLHQVPRVSGSTRRAERAKYRT
jgi:hypothetical protein